MSKNSRVYVGYDDVFTYRIRDAKETIDMFGEDYLEEYGYDIPQDKLMEYQALKAQWNTMQTYLRTLVNDQDNERYNR